MKFKSIIIGATGATGQKVLNQLIKNDNCSSITYIGRNKLTDSQIHTKINQIIIKSLLKLSGTKNLWKGHDVFFNCIGTTKKKAGSADKFYEIEYGISNEAARFASKGNIKEVSLKLKDSEWALDFEKLYDTNNYCSNVGVRSVCNVSAHGLEKSNWYEW